jgi:hypothetical protein
MGNTSSIEGVQPHLSRSPAACAPAPRSLPRHHFSCIPNAFPCARPGTPPVSMLLPLGIPFTSACDSQLLTRPNSVPVCRLRDRPRRRGCHVNRLAIPHHRSPFAPTDRLPRPLHPTRPPSAIRPPATHAPGGFPSALPCTPLSCPWCNLPPSPIRPNPVQLPLPSLHPTCTHPHNGFALTSKSPLLPLQLRHWAKTPPFIIPMPPGRVYLRGWRAAERDRARGAALFYA